MSEKKKGKISDDGFTSSFFDSCSPAVRRELAESRAKAYIASNLENAEKSRRQLEVVLSGDIELEKRRYRTKLSADTERNMVSIEKTHAKLAATGNVPGDMSGFAATILGSGSISPDSSASNKEFRECQKALLDSEARNARMVEALNNANIDIPHGPRTLKSIDHAEGIWTDNTENRDIIDDRYSFYGIEHDYLDTGKLRIIPC